MKFAAKLLLENGISFEGIGFGFQKIGGQKATSVLEMLREYVVPGVSTAKLDDLAFKFITEELKCIPANIGYGGFPKTLCTSINNFYLSSHWKHWN